MTSRTPGVLPVTEPPGFMHMATLTTLEKLVEEFGKYAYEHAIKLAVAATMCGDEKGAEHYTEIAKRLLRSKP